MMARTPLKTIFIRIPRTASESMIRGFLHSSLYVVERRMYRGKRRVRALHYDAKKSADVMCFGHRKLYRLIESGDLARENLADFWLFCVVRNPWERLISGWRYSHAHQPQEWRDDFALFVEEAIRNPTPDKPWRWASNMAPQVEFITLDGDVQADYIGRFEHIGHVWRHLRKMLQFEGKMPRMNSTSRRRYTHYYNKTTRAIVGRYYEQDCDTFKYTFTGAG
jgi:hypothetical protein